MCAKFQLIWSRLASTSFTNVQLDQKCKVDAGLTLAWWNWLKIGVLGLFGMVHIFIKFHSHWTHIASTCFTMWPTDKKLSIDNALTWVMGFGSNLVWWSYMVVGSFPKSSRQMGS